MLNYTTETEQMNAQLAMCVDGVTKISTLWASSGDEDRRGLAHRLFEEIIYDLDQQRIVGFRLKECAEQFLIVHGQLYQDGNQGYKCAPDRKRPFIRTSEEVVQIQLDRLYAAGTLLEQMQHRNQEIRRMFDMGIPKLEIARCFRISARRVGQILNDSGM